MLQAICVAFGGALGALCRFALVEMFQKAAWPMTGALAANMAGCAAAGVAAALLVPRGGLLWSLIVVGFLGGFTTFSSFALEVLEAGGVFKALSYAVLSVIGGLGGFVLTAELTRRLGG
jgi:CrcB protein